MSPGETSSVPPTANPLAGARGASAPARLAARRPLLAKAAALVLPGLGQVYNGEIWKGLALFSLLTLCTPVFASLAVWTHTRGSWALVVLGVVLAIAIYVYAIVDAYRTARRAGATYVLQPYNRPSAYLALFLGGYFFVLSPTVRHTKENVLELFKVPSSSMLPTIVAGDRFFADKSVNRPGGKNVWRGAVAVFIYPNNRTAMYVKRIIGLPGDKIEIKGTSIEVNGKSIEREPVLDLGDQRLNRLLEQGVAYREEGDRGSYVVLWKRDPPKDAPRAPLSLTVPNGAVFVLGDNRDAAQDSRQFGVVPLADVAGIGRQIWFSKGPGGIDWRRIGKSLE